MVTEIFINNTQIDLSDDLSIPLNYAIADIREPQKRNTNFSKTVVLPGTASNNVLFSHIWDIGVNLISSGNTNFNPTFNPNLKADVLIFQDGNEVFKGFAKLDNIVNTDGKVEYEMSFYGNLANIFTTLGESKLSDLDLSEYDHTYNKTNQVNSWDTSIIKNGSTYVNFSSGNPTGEGYVYPMIDLALSNPNVYKVSDWFPAIYAKTIIDKIFNEAGFQYSSVFLNSNFFKRLVIPYTNGNLKISQTQINEINTKVGVATDQQYTLQEFNTFEDYVDITNESSPYYDPNNNWTFNGTYYEYTAPYTNTHVIKLYVGFYVKHLVTDTLNLPLTGNYLCDINIYRENLSTPIGGQIISNTPIYLNQQGTWTSNSGIHIINYGFPTTGQSTPIVYRTITTTVQLNQNDKLFVKIDTYNNTVISPYVGGGDVGLYLVQDSYIDIKLSNYNLIEGFNLSMNDLLPESIKQADFLSSIFKMFNLYIDQDKTVSNKLIIEPRDDYYSSSGTTTLDWSYKLDYSKAYELKPMGDLESKNYIYQYKDDGDYYNEFYKKKWINNYGYKSFDIENDFLKSDLKTELIFSPTPLADYLTIDRIIPKIFVVDNNGVPKPKVANIRILYYGGVKTTSTPYAYQASSGTVNYNTYPYAGHLDDPLLPTIDLNFGNPIEVFYTTQNYTDNNLFNKYWRKFIQEITDINSKIFTGYFYLTPLDIASLDFKNLYYFEGDYWRLNRIFDYNPNQMSVTKCEFIKLIEYPTFVPTNTANTGTGVIEDGDSGWYNTDRIGSTFGSETLGENVFIPESAIGIKVNGSDITIGEYVKNISVIASSGIAIVSGINNTAIISSSGTVVNKSGALYINSLPIKDTGSAVRVKSITGNYTALWSDTVLLVNATGGNITVTLPDSGTVASPKDEMGKIFYVKKVDATANTVTIDGYSTQTIDGATTNVINTQYDSVTIVSDGSNWHII